MLESKLVLLEELEVIKNEKGNVTKFSNPVISLESGLKDAYFTSVKHSIIKGWNYHKKHTCKLIVLSGCVKFLLKRKFEDKPQSILIPENPMYALTINPNTWFAFMGVGSDQNLILNLLNGFHDDNETKKIEVSKTDALLFNAKKT